MSSSVEEDPRKHAAEPCLGVRSLATLYKIKNVTIFMTLIHHTCPAGSSCNHGNYGAPDSFCDPWDCHSYWSCRHQQGEALTVFAYGAAQRNPQMSVNPILIVLMLLRHASNVPASFGSALPSFERVY